MNFKTIVYETKTYLSKHREKQWMTAKILHSMDGIGGIENCKLQYMAIHKNISRKISQYKVKVMMCMCEEMKK